jgi:hypothetical protein
MHHFDKSQKNVVAVVFEVLYIAAGVFFTVGCLLMLYAEDLPLTARVLCLSGAAIFLANGINGLLGHTKQTGKYWEIIMDWFYIIGAGLFVVANVLKTPWGVAVPASPVIAVWCFISGSCLFVLGTFLNGAHAGDSFAKEMQVNPLREKALHKERAILLTVAFLTMLGSVGYLIGSILFLPKDEDGCDPGKAGDIGTWAFVIASFFFVLTGVLPLMVPSIPPKKEALLA